MKHEMKQYLIGGMSLLLLMGSAEAQTTLSFGLYASDKPSAVVAQF